MSFFHIETNEYRIKSVSVSMKTKYIIERKWLTRFSKREVWTNALYDSLKVSCELSDCGVYFETFEQAKNKLDDFLQSKEAEGKVLYSRTKNE